MRFIQFVLFNKSINWVCTFSDSVRSDLFISLILELHCSWGSAGRVTVPKPGTRCWLLLMLIFVAVLKCKGLTPICIYIALNRVYLLHHHHHHHHPGIGLKQGELLGVFRLIFRACESNQVGRLSFLWWSDFLLPILCSVHTHVYWLTKQNTPLSP